MLLATMLVLAQAETPPPRLEALASLLRTPAGAEEGAASRPANLGESSPRLRFTRSQDDAASRQAAASQQAADSQPAGEPPWSFSISAYAYFPPDDQNYVSETFTADHDWLHLEARHNYEAIDTGSLWVGYNLSFGDDHAYVELTPMVGGVFGRSAGVAPGLGASLGVGVLELYAEMEYLFDSRDSSDNFFYCWSELTVKPAEWVRFGVAAQRTQIYQTDLDTQRGPMVAVNWKGFEIATYCFNLGWEHPTWVFSASFKF